MIQINGARGHGRSRASRRMFHEFRELLRDSAPPLVKAQFFMHGSIGVVLVHHISDVVGAQRMIPRRYDRGDEGLFGWSPTTDQSSCEDDPFRFLDGEETGVQMR